MDGVQSAAFKVSCINSSLMSARGFYLFTLNFNFLRFSFTILVGLCKFFLTIQKTPNLQFHDSQFLLLSAPLSTCMCLHTTFPFKKNLEKIQGKVLHKTRSELGLSPRYNQKTQVSSRNTYTFGGEKWGSKLKYREGNGTPLWYSCLENPMDKGAQQAAVHGVAKSRTRLSDFTFTFHFHALEKEMATHSSVLGWRIPGTGEPGGLPNMGLHRVGHD